MRPSIRVFDLTAIGGPACAGPHPVGRKVPNPWGLFDVHGNVFVWAHDYFDVLPSTLRVDPIGPPIPMPTTGRTCRGGTWSEPAIRSRSAGRCLAPPNGRLLNAGVRPARSAP